MANSESTNFDLAAQALDSFQIEIPSWGFANTGTRFGKFAQPAAASTIEEKFADAAEVNRLTGSTPTLALHVLWDLPNGLEDIATVRELERTTGIRSGSINPNLFQDQEYKYGSLCNPNPAIRGQALAHMLDSIEIAKQLGSRDVSLWLPDGSNYPGSQSIRKRIEWLEQSLHECHERLAPSTNPSSRRSITPTLAIGVCRRIFRARPGRRRAFWWIPDTTMRRRISSRSSPG